MNTNPEILEKTFTGYCKSHNSIQTVFCEYESLPSGLTLSSISCNYKNCPNSVSCNLSHQALENCVRISL